MRKDRYVEQFAETIPYLQKIVLKSGLSFDEADDIIGACSEKLLVTKKYTSVVPSKLKSFLRTHIRFMIQNYKRNKGVQDMQVTHFSEPENTEEVLHVVTTRYVFDLPPVEERECPFCFKALLNEYGACWLCHTILPGHYRRQKTGYALSRESLAVEFDFNTALDIQQAIKMLTPFEQKVVNVIGLGNESLESFAIDNQVSKAYLVRTWVVAKEKLQKYLCEYADDDLPKRGPNAFREALVLSKT